MGQDRSGISGETVTSISGRLADLPDLRLPGQLTRNGEVGVAKRREYVAALLQRDPGVFLERHGEHLSANELMHFESLRSDHEVDFYLKALGDARGDSKSSALIRNRRLAHMQRLMAEGQEGALLDLMQQSFLAGHDPGIDYPAIDGDAELDEHWARLQAQDAEDRYFSD
ncbi:hypothetical protein F751_6364 [Auxenochlorella protothecoides]|uniref:CCD97-like C-terminal domain-containing protein n=1 Tax=Auxenochlorella protothecoides TaxID=3075 RepID=A0A087SSA1_AUXPR|nr:hypothetical protein F751_6364 [Auxenochlorella protothecoides]KFM28605.1 hypothetical protein F751_6364 [Auxenochlorella protothecoides]RMZ55803.1 hypothetical protein APUTEX25_005844 [Auxenochlorella protothecoides]|eukprot:RMZ55803.1 hypothetical protein APUTEX25_005844 [Auxenochlorella protothecoides]